MSLEGKNYESMQDISPENKPGNEITLSEVEALLHEREGIFSNLNQFSKDNLFKGEDRDLYQEIKVDDDLSDKWEYRVYAEASTRFKFINFITFGLFQKSLKFLKGLDGKLYDSIAINEEFNEKEFTSHPESVLYEEEKKKLSDKFDLKPEDFDKRTITRQYRYDKDKYKVFKTIKSRITESAAIEAAGKMLEDKINQIEQSEGARLIKLKESLERKTKEKKDLVKKAESASGIEENSADIKLTEEINQIKEKITEKEEKISTEAMVFKNPLEERLGEISAMENSLNSILGSINNSERDFNENLNKYQNDIEGMMNAELDSDVSDYIDSNKSEIDLRSNLKLEEFANKKKLISFKINILKDNKAEIELILKRIGNIGKINKEMGKDEKIKTGRKKINEDLNEIVMKHLRAEGLAGKNITAKILSGLKRGISKFKGRVSEEYIKNVISRYAKDIKSKSEAGE